MTLDTNYKTKNELPQDWNRVMSVLLQELEHGWPSTVEQLDRLITKLLGTVNQNDPEVQVFLEMLGAAVGSRQRAIFELRALTQ